MMQFLCCLGEPVREFIAHRFYCTWELGRRYFRLLRAMATKRPSRSFGHARLQSKSCLSFMCQANGRNRPIAVMRLVAILWRDAR